MGVGRSVFSGQGNREIRAWRIGYDNIANWGPDTPTNFFFTGTMRFAAVYTVALTDSQVAAHAAAGR